MRVIIAGSRKFNNYTYLETNCLNVFNELKSQGFNTSRDFMEIISGRAKGADTLGEKFADEYELSKKLFPAYWDDLKTEPCKIKYNKYNNPYNALAGINRNKDMAIYANEDSELGVLIAFYNGKSTGTLDMIKIARVLGLRVTVFTY